MSVVMVFVVVIVAAVTIILLRVVLRLVALAVLSVSSTSSASSASVAAGTSASAVAVVVALITSAGVAVVVVAAAVVVLAAIGAWSGWVASATASAIARVSLWLTRGTSRSSSATLLANTVLLLALAGELVGLHGVGVHGAWLGVDDESNGLGGRLALALPVDAQGATVGL